MVFLVQCLQRIDALLGDLVTADPRGSSYLSMGAAALSLHGL